MPFREVRMIRSPVLVSLVLALAAALPAAAAEPVLIRNVRIFDGVDKVLALALAFPLRYLTSN
jgi:hypothetical protein